MRGKKRVVMRPAASEILAAFVGRLKSLDTGQCEYIYTHIAVACTQRCVQDHTGDPFDCISRRS